MTMVTLITAIAIITALVMFMLLMMMMMIVTMMIRVVVAAKIVELMETIIVVIRAPNLQPSLKRGNYMVNVSGEQLLNNSYDQ